MRISFARPIMLATVIAGLALLGACTKDAGAPDDGNNPSVVGGSWTTQYGLASSINFQLVQTDAALSGGGTIGIPALAPVTGPSTPSYTGDDFTITTGTYNAPNLTFTATLGANPDGAGGFYRGTLTFTGTLSGATIVGTARFTPPKTATQIFSEQVLAGASLTKGMPEERNKPSAAGGS